MGEDRAVTDYMNNPKGSLITIKVGLLKYLKIKQNTMRRKNKKD